MQTLSRKLLRPSQVAAQNAATARKLARNPAERSRTEAFAAGGGYEPRLPTGPFNAPEYELGPWGEYPAPQPDLPMSFAQQGQFQQLPQAGFDGPVGPVDPLAPKAVGLNTPAPVGLPAHLGPTESTSKPAWGQQHGPQAANGILDVLGGINDMLGASEQKHAYSKMMQRQGSTDAMGPSNPPNPFGDYTLNAGIGNNFQPTQHTPTQRFAYATGGEYQLSPEEITDLRAQGYEIEELD